MNRSTAIAVRGGSVALGAVSLITQVWAIPALVSRTTVVFPEATPYAPLAVGGGVVLVACIQLALIVVWRLTGLTMRGIPISDQGLVWVKVLAGIASLFAALAIVAAVMLMGFNWNPAGVMLGLAAAATVGGIGALASWAYVANYRREWRTN